MAEIPGPSQFVKYVYDIRAFIAIIVGLFVVSAAIGYMIPGASPDAAKSLLAGLQEKADQLSGQSSPVMMLGIFANNVMGSLMAMIFGLAAGLFPILFIVSNGMVIGIVLELIVVKMGAGAGLLVFALGILPHGIFELPAVFLSAAIGLKLGYEALRSLYRRQDSVTGELMRGLMIFLFWVLPILLVAAFVETYVTGAIIGYLVPGSVL